MEGRDEFEFVPLEYQRYADDEQLRRAIEFRDLLASRRTVRHFSSDAVSDDVIEAVVATAASAPSGANQQPWRFVVVTSSDVKRRIREAAEAEERDNYSRRFPDAWKRHLEPLGTDWHKEFIEVAPALVVVFRIDYDDASGAREKHYYVMESVGIACGLLIAAIHNAGLVTVTHTPNPMGFLSEILGRPKNERPYLLLPVGYPAEGARVPDIRRKTLAEVLTRVE